MLSSRVFSQLKPKNYSHFSVILEAMEGKDDRSDIIKLSLNDKVLGEENQLRSRNLPLIIFFDF